MRLSLPADRAILGGMKRAALFAAVCLVAVPASADELKLKDGTKIVGTIVGYENDAFKVETAYGFAVVKKDKVASIILSEAKAEGKAEAKKEVAEKKSAPAPPPAKAPVQEAPKPTAGAPTASAAKAPAPPTPAPAPATPPAEPAMQETVEGNAYINHTYGFRMFKPPSWRVIEGAQKLLPSAIVAMGTTDETTLLVLGRGTLRGSLDAHMSTTEKQLKQIYENYRVTGEENSVVGGMPAVVRRFRGSVNEHDWSGLVVSFGRGNEVFTLLGMTYADSDLIQIQENAISRVVKSLEFVK